MPLYIPHKINIPTDQHDKLKRAIDGQTKSVTRKINKDDIQKQNSGEHTLLLTTGQILKLQRAQSSDTACTIIMRRKQIEANMRHEGGFLPILAGLASKILPVLLGSVASGVLSGGIERAIRGKGNGFLYQNWYKMSPTTKGKGLYLSPRPRFPGNYGNGLFVKRGKEISDGSGLILGPNSPFKNIPLLNLIL